MPGHGNGSSRRTLTLDEFVEGIGAGDRAVLARAITLAESQRPDHQELSQALLEALLPSTGRAIRVGITGVPGAGKSSFIETLGITLVKAGHKVAVLAVDPSSGISGGSILGDKTRMSRLATAEGAFIRPSPSSGTLGGVAQKTREAMLLCEAAGYDVVLIETVGVGQSETVVAGMTDVFLALLLSGAGDELQGIKRGLLELVDVLAVNKADGDNTHRAEAAAREIATALHIVHGGRSRQVPVLTCSATEDTGVEEVWRAVTQIHSDRQDSGRLQARRCEQALSWMHSLLEEGLLRLFRRDEDLRRRLEVLESEVSAGAKAPYAAVRELLDRFTGRMHDDEG